MTKGNSTRKVVTEWRIDCQIHRRMEENLQQLIMDAKQCMGCMHEGLIVTSSDGVIVETSPAAERILEAPSMSLKGKQVREICPIGRPAVGSPDHPCVRGEAFRGSPLDRRDR